MIELPVSGAALILLVMALYVGLLCRATARLKRANQTIRQQTRAIERQTRTIHQLRRGASPYRAAVGCFDGPRDVTGFFAECGRSYLKYTDISEIEAHD